MVWRVSGLKGLKSLKSSRLRVQRFKAERSRFKSSMIRVQGSRDFSKTWHCRDFLSFASCFLNGFQLVLLSGWAVIANEMKQRSPTNSTIIAHSWVKQGHFDFPSASSGQATQCDRIQAIRAIKQLLLILIVSTTSQGFNLHFWFLIYFASAFSQFS